MLRLQSNEKKTCCATMEASARETEAALSQRRQEMDQAWDDIDEGWQALKVHMTEVGINKALESKEGMVQLNVGGSLLNFRRSVLERTGEQQSSTWTLGNLFEVEWDKRVPRDSDGRIVLDESPTCVKHLIHALLLRHTSADGTGTGEGDMCRDDPPELLPYTARVLGLSQQPATIGMSITGGTTIFEPHEAGKLTAIVQLWCPRYPGGLKLLYRASRDGWYGTTCQDRGGHHSGMTTITFFRVKGRGAPDTDSIIGGVSSTPWEDCMYDAATGYYSPSPGAFLFMLKDGNGGRSGFCHSTKWGVKDGRSAYAVYCGQGYGPCFGEGRDLHVVWKGTSSTVLTGNLTYDVPAASPFLELNGRRLVDVETFRFCPQRNISTSSANQEHHEDTTGPAAPVRTAEDVRTFGHLVADSLMEEGMLLQEAVNELSLANARATVCATALAEVYGPDVASGKGDDVVELSVRGTRMTPLRSTLRIYPDSALAAWFNEERWPAAKKDLDSNGRRIIDCKPSVFSKVLDLLRMEKHAAWARGDEWQGRDEKPRITISADDRAAFEEFMNMYFPGCEMIIMLRDGLLGDGETDR